MEQFALDCVPDSAVSALYGQAKQDKLYRRHGSLHLEFCSSNSKRTDYSFFQAHSIVLSQDRHCTLSPGYQDGISIYTWWYLPCNNSFQHLFFARIDIFSGKNWHFNFSRMWYIISSCLQYSTQIMICKFLHCSHSVTMISDVPLCKVKTAKKNSMNQKR